MDIYENADEESSMWRELVNVWWDEYGDKPVRPMELIKLCNDNQLMQDIIGHKKGKHAQSTALGKALAQKTGAVFNGSKRIMKTQVDRGRTAYALKTIENYK